MIYASEQKGYKSVQTNFTGEGYNQLLNQDYEMDDWIFGDNL